MVGAVLSGGHCVRPGGGGTEEERTVVTPVIVEARTPRDVLRNLSAGQGDYLVLRNPPPPERVHHHQLRRGPRGLLATLPRT